MAFFLTAGTGEGATDGSATRLREGEGTEGRGEGLGWGGGEGAALETLGELELAPWSLASRLRRIY
jgi:hypothetical protein